MAKQLTEQGAMDILNTIRAEASDQYRGVVPHATRDNLSLVGNPIVSGQYQYIGNECINTLINKIVKTIVWTRVYNNPLRALKQGLNPLGGDIEEIHTNPLEEQDDDLCCESTILDSCENDIEVEYHRRNRVKKYCVCVNRAKLRTAFTSYRALATFINNLIAQLYSSNQIDEFRYTKQMFAEAYDEDKIVKQQVVYPSDTQTAKNFAKAIRNVARQFKYPNSNFNAWEQVTGRTPRITWTPPEQRILIIRSDVLTELDYELLAWVFQIDVARVEERIIEVDNFGTNDNILAILADEAYAQIYDNDEEVTDFWDGSVRSWKYWFHVEQTYSVSLFANAVAFTTEAIVPPVVDTVTVSPATTDIIQGGNQQFTATVSGTGVVPQTVTWSVAPTTAGVSISTSGNLTIGAEVPVDTALTVTATSTADTSKTGTSTVTVVAQPAVAGKGKVGTDFAG